MPVVTSLTFTRRETPTIMSGLVVRFEAEVYWRHKPEINASREGVSIDGAWPVMSAEAVEQVKAQLDEAVKEAERIRGLQPWYRY